MDGPLMVYVVFFDGVENTYLVREMPRAETGGAVSVFDARAAAEAHVVLLKNG